MTRTEDGIVSDPEGLGWDRGDDPQLYDLYARKLLIPGWAGKLTPMEREYRRRRRKACKMAPERLAEAIESPLKR